MYPISAGNHSIYFNEHVYSFLETFIHEKRYSNVFILVDSNTSEHCLSYFLSSLVVEVPPEIIELEPGEEHKTIATCVEVWQTLIELGADRKTLLINLGGGVVTDLGGFVASTFKRGIDFINVPTSLLGMVDAAIGGKNGVDLGPLKNQIGVINAPQAVLIDTDFLSTLPSNQMRSGLAEMLKHGLIYDQKYWEKFNDLSQLDYTDLDELIYRSIEIKNEIVQQDPTENGIRKALNFGHTLGHAIESYFLESEEKKSLLHGEAIAVGMILEAYLSYEKKLLSWDDYLEIKTLLISLYEPLVFTEKDIEIILNYLIHDKKNEYGKIQFALLDGIGQISLNQYFENQQIISAFDDYKK
ncbi:MAG: 3-dehydroquinate synthase [Flavobacteriales bacterium]|nr:3-dehydroquinate synthase [Flavobacteriales bacterium]